MDEKYKASYLPTKRSRKLRTIFVYAANDDEAVAKTGEELSRRFMDFDLISVQRPDRTFIGKEGSR